METWMHINAEKWLGAADAIRIVKNEMRIVRNEIVTDRIVEREKRIFKFRDSTTIL